MSALKDLWKGFSGQFRVKDWEFIGVVLAIFVKMVMAMVLFALIVAAAVIIV